jgi:HK97 family phage major capsid protein
MRTEIHGRVYDSTAAMIRRVEERDAENAGGRFDEETREEWNALNAAIDEEGKRLERIRELARSPYNCEDRAGLYSRDRRAAHDAGLGTIERYRHHLTAEAADRLDELVRRHDPSGTDARYLAAVGDPAYNHAFGKTVADPTTGHLRFTPEEVAAVQRVGSVEVTRAMAIGTGSTGGFAVPFELDLTILLTSNGALNPIRQLARVITVSTDQWKGLSSAGVTAAYQAEAAAVTDASPTLAQPVIDCAMWRCFVPFSIELGQDWGTLQGELTRLISDARDVLDATQFLTGSGTDSPAGVLTGLTTSQRVQTAGGGRDRDRRHLRLEAGGAGQVHAERHLGRAPEPDRQHLPADAGRVDDGAAGDADSPRRPDRPTRDRVDDDGDRQHDWHEVRALRRLPCGLHDRRSDRHDRRTDPPSVRGRAGQPSDRPARSFRLRPHGLEGGRSRGTPLRRGSVMASKQKLVVARESFSTELDGKEVLIHLGQVIPASHKLVKEHKHLFEPVEPQPPRP